METTLSIGGALYVIVGTPHVPSWKTVFPPRVLCSFPEGYVTFWIEDCTFTQEKQIVCSFLEKHKLSLFNSWEKKARFILSFRGGNRALFKPGMPVRDSLCPFLSA